eukprot:1157595-Pelagomonas_calceolata.AAC.17
MQPGLHAFKQLHPCHATKATHLLVLPMGIMQPSTPPLQGHAHEFPTAQRTLEDTLIAALPDNAAK